MCLVDVVNIFLPALLGPQIRHLVLRSTCQSCCERIYSVCVCVYRGVLSMIYNRCASISFKKAFLKMCHCSYFFEFYDFEYGARNMFDDCFNYSITLCVL